MVCPYFIPEEPRIHREQEFFRSLLGEWVNQERISHNPLERILEGLRLEVADYYCRTEPRIKCP